MPTLWHLLQACDYVPDAAFLAQTDAEARTSIRGLGAYRAGPTCLYTVADDGKFLLGPVHASTRGTSSTSTSVGLKESDGGRAPAAPSVFLAAGFAGSGFKHTPLVGKILSSLVRHGRSEFDIAKFDPARPQASAAPTARLNYKSNL